MGTWIRCIGIGVIDTRYICAKSVFIESVELKTLIETKITLVDLKVNDFYLLSFMGLIFALTKEVNY